MRAREQTVPAKVTVAATLTIVGPETSGAPVV